MLTQAELLEPLARVRTDEVVITTMGVVRPWGVLSDHDLDFASADSAMGHAADLALGVALACPDRRVLCLNGDGSMLMSLGTLVTITDARATNLVLFVIENGAYEITGNQPIPGRDTLDLATMARAAGFPKVYRVDRPERFAELLPEILRADGPVFVSAFVESGRQGPISRSASEDARYLRTSLAEWSWAMRAALTREGG